MQHHRIREQLTPEKVQYNEKIYHFYFFYMPKKWCGPGPGPPPPTPPQWRGPCFS